MLTQGSHRNAGDSCPIYLGLIVVKHLIPARFQIPLCKTEAILLDR